MRNVLRQAMRGAVHVAFSFSGMDLGIFDTGSPPLYLKNMFIKGTFKAACPTYSDNSSRCRELTSQAIPPYTPIPQQYCWQGIGNLKAIPTGWKHPCPPKKGNPKAPGLGYRCDGGPPPCSSPRLRNSASGFP